MSDTINFISTAINKIYAHDEDMHAIATQYLNQHSGDIATLKRKLDLLCDGDFFAQVELKKIIPSATVAETINAAVTANGGTALNTNAYIPVGTLGSSYSCTSTSDTSPTLIATGKNTIPEMIREAQKCAIWSVFARDGACKGEPVYISYSPSGSCFAAQSCDDGAGAAYAYCMYGLDH